MIRITTEISGLVCYLQAVGAKRRDNISSSLRAIGGNLGVEGLRNSAPSSNVPTDEISGMVAYLSKEGSYRVAAQRPRLGSARHDLEDK